MIISFIYVPISILTDLEKPVKILKLLPESFLECRNDGFRFNK